MHDLWTLRGVGIKPEQFPMILGCDGAGRLDDGTEVVIYPVIGDPAVAGDETLDPSAACSPSGCRDVRRRRGGAGPQRPAAPGRADRRRRPR